MPNSQNGRSAPEIEAPTNSSGHGNVLKVGRGISIYCDLQPSNAWPEHRHSTTQIVLALDPVDTDVQWGNDQKHRESCSVPHLWCVPHGTYHSATWTGKAAMVVFYVERDLVVEECQAELKEGMVFALAPLLQQDYLFAQLCSRFREHCHRRKLMSEPMMFACAIMLSVAVLHLCIGRSRARNGCLRGLSKHQMEILAHFLENRLRDPLTPTELAAMMGISVDHFGRMLRLSTGLSPMRYVWRCRLHRARQLLETGNWKVSEVATECGFFDQSHLDRRFRREFGCTPGFVIPS